MKHTLIYLNILVISGVALAAPLMPADQTRFELANAFVRVGKTAAARILYKDICTRAPTYAKLWFNIGLVHAQEGDIDAAVHAFEHVMHYDPTHTKVLPYAGIAYHLAQQYEKALDCYTRSFEQMNDTRLVRHNCAMIHYAQNNLATACCMLEDLVYEYPDYTTAQYNLSMVYLKMGNFSKGWPAYRARFDVLPNAFSRKAPEWDGSSIAGKTILVEAEQGFGDSMQCVRYLRCLRDDGATVFFRCPKALVPLMLLQPYIDTVIPYGKKASKTDFRIALMQLPEFYSKTVDTIPADTPYLQADPILIKKWKTLRTHYKNKFLIGICWHGAQKIGMDCPDPMQKKMWNHIAQERSIPLCTLQALGTMPHIQLISLQKHDPDEVFPTWLHTFDESFDAEAFMDTAATMHHLDCVLTIDTSIAHLAGGLGIKTWVMLPHTENWRWLIDRTDSPWYPTMRLFKQPTPGDWDSVLIHVIKALAQEIA